MTEKKKGPGRPKGSKDTQRKSRKTEDLFSVEEVKSEASAAAPDPFEGTSPPPPPPPGIEEGEDLDDEEESFDAEEDTSRRLSEPEAELYAGLAVAVTSAAFVFLGKMLVRDRPDLADDAEEIARLSPDEQAKLLPIFAERLKELELSGETALVGALLSIAAIKATALWGLKQHPVIPGLQVGT